VVALNSPASAATTVTRVALIPKLALNLDVANGSGTSLATRDNSVVSADEQWDVVDTGQGFVRLKSRGESTKVGFADFIDVRDGLPITQPGQTSLVSQRWVVVKNSDGTTSFKNQSNNKFLSFAGVGSPSFVFTTTNGAGAHFVVKKL
jgi:tetraacyldisaccharide-1-P 4'-kinase